jgi:purine-nucleoside phosphorylase
MGLCGGLRSQLRVGDVVVYETCIMPNETGMLEKRTCDRLLTEWLQSRLPQAKIVTAYTSDRLIQTCVEKQNLAQYNSVDVVDMESFIILKHLQALGLRVAVLRVLSDDAQQTLPDLTPALSPEGNLKPFPLAIALLQHPVSAFQLIRSSLSGLQQLKQITAQLFSPLD